MFEDLLVLNLSFDPNDDEDTEDEISESDWEIETDNDIMEKSGSDDEDILKK